MTSRNSIIHMVFSIAEKFLSSVEIFTAKKSTFLTEKNVIELLFAN